MKTEKWYYFWSKGQNSFEFVETRKLATSVKEIREWAKREGVEIDGRIRVSKRQF